jgi:hypothetical protein
MPTKEEAQTPQWCAPCLKWKCQPVNWHDPEIFIRHNEFGKSLCTYKMCWESIERIIVSKNWIKQLHTLPVLHFKRCLTTEYSETTAHFNGNFDADKKFYVPQPKCTATFRTHCLIKGRCYPVKCQAGTKGSSVIAVPIFDSYARRGGWPAPRHCHFTPRKETLYPL